jgi:NAD(P)-dependent dehydrogenase (short-subunit alcohol dehydrogenase family)
MTPANPLHVTVFGATGGIGRHVIDQLLNAGHRVTAYVRNRTTQPVEGRQPTLESLLRRCPGRGSNPHGPLGPEGFKPSASASSATRAGWCRGRYRSRPDR